MSKKILQKAVSLGLSAFLSISGGICPQNQVVRADEVYFESRTIQDSNPEDKINEESATDSAIEILNLDERNANSVQVGAFTITGENLTQGTDYNFTGTTGTNGVLAIISSKDMTIKNIDPNTATNDRIEINSEANLTLNGVNIVTGNGPALKIADNATFNVTITLADGSTNTLKGKEGTGYSDPGSPGIQKNGDSGVGMLTITGSTGENAGILKATGGYGAAGIGGGLFESGSNITISGGTVTATGGECRDKDGGAGIGGGWLGSGSDITISGGTVTATGAVHYGAGIGGGAYGSGGSNITISGGVVTATSGVNAAGIGGGAEGSGSNITISGGTVTATGDFGGAGIGGGGAGGSGSDITISGGTVTATGGIESAGIGGGSYSDGSDITISGGTVTATGGSDAAGIGGGIQGSGSNITISGGTVTANGGTSGAGIGGGSSGGSGSDNSLNGDAVVLATGGDASKAALEGFADSDLNQGITFTRQTTSGIWSGTMYGNVTLSQNLEIPANLTVPTNQILTVKNGITLNIPAGVTLKNEGTLTINGTVTCEYDEQSQTTGKVNTKTDFYREGSTTVYKTGYQTYKTSEGQQKYKDLPNPDESNGTLFDGWYTESGGKGTKLDETVDVLLNHHDFYEYRVSEKHTITIDQIENGTITPDVTEAEEGDEIGFTITPDEGYELKDGSVKVTDENGNEVPVTEKDGKYTFIMPGSGVKIDAIFEEASYEISIDQPEHGTINPDKDKAKEGDEVSFTIIPDEGYELKDGSVKVTDENGNEVPVTEKDGKYTFIMPNSGVKIDAIFELIPNPGPVPSPTPTSEINGGSFSWDVLEYDTSVTPTPTDQVEKIETKTLKDIQNQVPQTLKEIAYVIGYGDGTFKPENNITRAEAAQMIYKLIYNGTKVNYDALQKFSDVNQTAWYSTAVAYLTDQGLIDGDGGKFYSNRQITRAEMSKILYNALLKYDKDQDKKLVYGTSSFNFTDITNNWSFEPIKQLATNNMIDGYGDGTFKSNQNITRAESVAIIAKVFDRSQTFSQRVSFKDVLPSHWAYKYIMNAVNGEN